MENFFSEGTIIRIYLYNICKFIAIFFSDIIKSKLEKNLFEKWIKCVLTFVEKNILKYKCDKDFYSNHDENNLHSNRVKTRNFYSDFDNILYDF